MSDQINQDDRMPEKKQRKFFKSTAAKVILSVVVVLFVVFTIKGIALARYFHKFHDGPPEFIIEHLTENLNLTGEQKAQVQRIKDQIKEKMETNKPDRESGIDEFLNEFKKDNLDKSRLKELAQKKEQRHEEMKDFMMDKLIEFHNILTAEQRTKAVENMQEMKNKFHDKMEHFKGKGDKQEKFDKRND